MKLTQAESEVLRRFRRGERPSFSGSPECSEDWIQYGLGLALDAGARIRAIRQARLSDCTSFKQDGTPSTREEEDIERDLRRSLQESVPGAVLIGEEGGGEWRDRGLAVAIDPIDGTWAFINHAETFTTSLAVFNDSKVFLGIIFNPSTGELAYSATGRPARLVQVSMLGEPNVGVDLPLEPPGRALLLNVHPSRPAGAVLNRLYQAWRDSGVQMVKAVGGSPSWAMVEAAKGRFVYVNLWARQAAAPFDLAAGVALLRGAGGDVVDLRNRPVSISGHEGPFVAGMDASHRLRTVSLVADVAEAVMRS